LQTCKGRIRVIKKPQSAPDQNPNDTDLKLIEKPGPNDLLRRIRARGGPGLLNGALNTIGHESNR
jgi:hypothetical protein